MKTLILFLLLAGNYSFSSPSGRLTLDVKTGETTLWSLSVDGTCISRDNRIEYVLDGGRVLGRNTGAARVKTGSSSETIPVNFYRCSSIQESYNFLTLSLKDYCIEFRAYDEGVAYRAVTRCRDSLVVLSERAEFNTSLRPSGAVVGIKKTHPYPYESSFEAEYSFLDAGQLENLRGLDASVPEGRHAYLPLVVDEGKLGKVILMESDVLDYPGIFVRHSSAGFNAQFTPRVLKFHYSKRYNKRREAFSSEIARVSGAFSFPWRIVGWAENDRDLPTNNLVYALASPCRVDDISWVKPGLTTWDWWNGRTLFGTDVEAGINTAFYKYHIDFAAAYGVPYILIDEGWYEAPDVMNPIEDVNLEELCAYAASKNVGIWLWSTAHLLDYCGLDKVFEKYSSMGIAGFKLDFIDGQDQESVALVTRIAQTAAKYRLMLDYHGIYKPCGLNRTYPNVLNFEGVFGLEQRGEDMPLNDVTIPYLRQVAGPLDYTPGCMTCFGKVGRDKIGRQTGFQGTRAHQVALYLVFDAPFGMLCDSPSRYMADAPTTGFITSIPTVFDESFVQSGTIGESIVMVRRSGDKWYVGGITNSSERVADVDFSFLPQGRWTATLYRDGVNVGKCANDYKIESFEVSNKSSRRISMAAGGGFSMVLGK